MGKARLAGLPFAPSLRTFEDPHPPNQPTRHSGGGILQTMLQEQLRLPSSMAEKFGDSCAKQEENHPYIYLRSFHALVKRSDSAKAEFVYREALGTPPRAADQAGRLRALAERFRAVFNFGLHGPGRVRESRFGSLGIVQASVANPPGIALKDSRPSSGAGMGSQLLDSATESVDVVPQESLAAGYDQHVDGVEANLDVGLVGAIGQPASRSDLEVAAGNLTALERAVAVLLDVKVDEDQAVPVIGNQVNLGSLAGDPIHVEDLVSLALEEANGCPGCLLLKFVVVHDDLRLLGPAPLACLAIQRPPRFLARAREKAKTRKGSEFCGAKVFRTLPADPGSVRA